MTYNNYDDSRVQIPREMFEARQRQLAAVGGGGGVGDSTRRQLSHKIRSRSHRGGGGGGDTGGGQEEEEDTPPSTTDQDTGTSTSLQPGDLGWAEYAGLGSIPLQPHLRSV